MSKKMKRVAFDSSVHVLDEDARARFQHQSLLQDYLELQQETESTKIKLMTMKQKKQTLQAEVSFLRRRYKFLTKNKSPIPHQQVVLNAEKTRIGKSKKEKFNAKKEMPLSSLPPIHKLNQKGRVHTQKKNAIRGAAYPVVNAESQVLNLNPREILELSEKESPFGGQEGGSVRTRVPLIDLNQISREEEELQERHEMDGLSRNGAEDEQNADVKLLICRNVRDASTSQTGKRKISWQDPVALRV